MEAAGCLSIYQTTALFEQLAHGVGAAHREGIVHRDLKPGNILVGPSRSASSPLLLKVLDFGIAKLMKSDRTSTRGMGTPLWMAPEQSGVRTHVGPQAYVWALGLIVYYCLTGKIYWRCAHDETASNTAILREMLIDELELPSRRAESMGSRFPHCLDAWWLRCVARDPAQRFDDAASAFAHFVVSKAMAPVEANAGPSALAALVEPQQHRPPPQVAAQHQPPAPRLTEPLRAPQVNQFAQPAPAASPMQHSRLANTELGNTQLAVPINQVPATSKPAMQVASAPIAPGALRPGTQVAYAPVVNHASSPPPQLLRAATTTGATVDSAEPRKSSRR